MALHNLHLCSDKQAKFLVRYIDEWVLLSKPRSEPEITADGNLSFTCKPIASGLKFCPWCGKELPLPTFVTQEEFERGFSATAIPDDVAKYAELCSTDDGGED